MSDLAETVEIATLDKEMAEEKVGMNFCSVIFVLTLVLLNSDIPCLCKQCRSRSVDF